MWFKNAIIYSLDIETFMDGDADGIGDFRGLRRHVGYFERLGVTCIWLQPFQPTPNRDDGYDVIDYYAVDPRLGTLGDFAEFVQALEERGIRLIVDLVVNHTSTDHPWFKAACADPRSPYRDYYLWAAELPPGAHEGMAFPGVQSATWTWNEQAQAFYHHRFFAHQPDLNIANPKVREEILHIIGYWLRLGVAGFRVDAAPFLIELTDPKAPQSGAMYRFLEDMRAFLSWRRGDAILLAEANVEHKTLPEYFGAGNRMHMLFDFLVNQALFLALATERADPLLEALARHYAAPATSHWAQFLRGHDELDLGRLSEEERQEVYRAFGPSPDMQIFDRGIRRRLATMMNNDRRRIEMAHSLMFSLPGCQVLRYGDEIGMGDDLSLEGRRAVRTPMQWSDEANGGFSAAPPEKLIRPVISAGEYGYRRVNVQAQGRDPNSLLNRIERLIRVRRSAPEIGLGTLSKIDVDRPSVIAYRYDRDGRAIAFVHNLAGVPCKAKLDIDPVEIEFDLAGDQLYPRMGASLDLSAYGYRWLRLR